MRESVRGEFLEPPVPPSVDFRLNDVVELSEHFPEETLLLLGEWAPALLAERNYLEKTFPLDMPEPEPHSSPSYIIEFMQSHPATAKVLGEFVGKLHPSMDDLRSQILAATLYASYLKIRDEIEPLTPTVLDHDVTRIETLQRHKANLLAETKGVVQGLKQAGPDQNKYDALLKELTRMVGPLHSHKKQGVSISDYVRGMMVMSKFAQLEHEEEGDAVRIASRFARELLNEGYEEEVPNDPDSPKWKFGTIRDLVRQEKRMRAFAYLPDPQPRLNEIKDYHTKLVRVRREELVAEYIYAATDALHAAELAMIRKIDTATDFSALPYSLLNPDSREEREIAGDIQALDRVPAVEQLREQVRRFLVAFNTADHPATAAIHEAWNKEFPHNAWKRHVSEVRDGVRGAMSGRLETHMNGLGTRHRAFLDIVGGHKPRAHEDRPGRSRRAAKSAKTALLKADELTENVFNALADVRELGPKSRSRPTSEQPDDELAAYLPSGRTKKGERVFTATETTLLSVIATGEWENLKTAYAAFKKDYVEVAAFAKRLQCVGLVEAHSITRGGRFDLSKALLVVKAKIDKHSPEETIDVLGGRASFITDAIDEVVRSPQASAVLQALFKLWQPLIRAGIKPGATVPSGSKSSEQHGADS
jgi:hypothetical protein